MKTTVRIRLLAIASVHLGFLSLAWLAHSAPAADTPERPLEVTIKSGSGKERYPVAREGFIDWVGLAPQQAVEIKLKFKDKARGEAVLISALDGGTLGAHDGLVVESGGNAKFTYTAAGQPGLYRLHLFIAGEEYWFSFYVLNTTDPTNNPPRVRVIE